MVRTVNAAVTTVVTTAPTLKRENCTHTKHDSVFSDWKILIGACDWEDYLLNKEGAERYRTQNLPNCSSCPGLYELGIAVSVTRKKGKIISKLNSKNIIPVYLGQADNVRTRLQQYGRDGAHLENGLSNGEQNDRKVLVLFSDIFSYGFSIAFRWTPMESKKDAERTETQLLKTFDYAWNRGMNGERRPNDIRKKLNNTGLHRKRVHLVFNKIRVFPPKEVGLRIKRCDPPVLENGSSFYTKQIDTSAFVRIFKFGRSRPILVSKDGNMNNSDVNTCGVALGHGSTCIRPAVEGRKRCTEHKGMKVNAYIRPYLNLETGTLVSEDCNLNNNNVGTCGVALGNGSICIRPPIQGRKRCAKHKGMKVNTYISPRLDLESGTFCNSQKRCEEVKHEGMMVNEKKSKIPDADSLTCAAITLNGSCCRRKPSKDSKFCWQHVAIRTNINN